MQGITAKRLVDAKKQILTLWATRAKKEVDPATTISELRLSDSLPKFLDHLAEGLATSRKLDFRSLELHDAESVRIGKLHGSDRAGSSSYLLTDVLFEYHILRQVIFEILEEKERLSKAEQELILDALEQAVNDAAVEFTEVHADIQEKFISTLTHDLRNPISAAKINAQMIVRGTNVSESSHKSGERIVLCLNRVDSMIQNLLDASRIRAGHELHIEYTECELESIIRDVLTEMSLLHGDRFILYSNAKVNGKFGKSEIRRTVENLVGNAVKYSALETPITISLSEAKNLIQIKVHNGGNPIPEKEQSILFEQYRRTKNAEETLKTGWGLGLTLVKGVATAHNGTIRVESSLEKGTTFIFEIPNTASRPVELQN